MSQLPTHTPTIEDTQQRLNIAAVVGNIDDLYTSIKEKPGILDHIDSIPFVDTPLHIAASAGQTHFAVEILSLKPSFGQKLNPDGFSPLHLVLQTLKNKRVNADGLDSSELEPQIYNLTKTVKQLIKFDGELVRVKGKRRHTPLHLVAEEDELDLLAEFLSACPGSIEDVTVQRETAVHIAVKRSNLGAFEVLLGWLCTTKNEEVVLNMKDEEGNTVLHTVVLTSQPQFVKLLIEQKAMSKNEKNLEGLTALDIAKRHVSNEPIETTDMHALQQKKDLESSSLPLDEPKTKIVNALLEASALESTSLPEDCSLAGALRLAATSKQILKDMEQTSQSRDFFKMNLSMEMLNVILVVAVLIATTTYQAVLSPPGGGLLDNSSVPLDHNSTAAVADQMLINGTIFTYNLLLNNNDINSTTNTTTNITDPFKRVLFSGKPITVESFFVSFYFLNTSAFVFSILVMIIILPWHFVNSLLHLSLLCLMLSYGYTFYVITPSYSMASYFLIATYVFSFLGYTYLIGKLFYKGNYRKLFRRSQRQKHTQGIRMLQGLTTKKQKLNID